MCVLVSYKVGDWDAVGLIESPAAVAFKFCVNFNF